MISKNQIKKYSLLKQKKYRKEENRFIVEGKKLVEELINSNFEIEVILITNSFQEKNKLFIDKLSKHKIQIELIQQKEFDKLAETETPQGIIAIAKMKEQKFSLEKISSGIIIGFENINEPGNLGTMLRTADWFGFNDIIISKNSVELYNPKTIRSSMGSIFHLNIYDDIDLYDICEDLKKNNYKIYCSDTNGESIDQLKYNEKFIVVFSNEANGPTEELIKISDRKITIPSRGKAESLNVSSACSIILYEISKNFGNKLITQV